MKAISLGVGRTGTNSLRLALNQLGLGPCHHMYEVFAALNSQAALWQAAANGNPDWGAIYDGFNSAVDWPTAAFAEEIYATYPNAKYILSTRSTESWVASFTATIYKSLAITNKRPPELDTWHAMAVQVIAKTGFPFGLSDDELASRFDAHNAMVKDLIPADQLLVFEAADGWEPLCAHLGVPVPDGPYPRSNNRVEFWEKVQIKDES